MLHLGYLAFRADAGQTEGIAECTPIFGGRPALSRPAIGTPSPYLLCRISGQGDTVLDAGDLVSVGSRPTQWWDGR